MFVKSSRRTFSVMASLSKSASIAPKDFNRWHMVAPAVFTHLSIGGLYAWSVLNEPLARTLGVITSVPGDWGLSSVVSVKNIPVFSLAVFAAGGTAALSGSWSERVGPRSSVALAGTLWGSGLMLGALAVHIHSLPLLYLGYGAVGGMGIGFAYGPPVAALLRWFPDKKGLASGMVIMGFGSGALVALPLMKALTERSFVPPPFLGTDVETTVLEGGIRVLSSDLTTRVLVATQADIQKLGLSAPHVLESGVYAVGGGNTGVSSALFGLGLVYMATMWAAALSYKIPSSEWTPPQTTTTTTTATTTTATAPNDPLILPSHVYIPASSALQSRQFGHIWLNLFLNATAGIAVLGVAKTLMSDVFGTSNPLVDASFCALFVAALSLSNGLGRLAWASASDHLGRKNTFSLFFALGIPLYLSVPYCAHLGGSTSSLVMFSSSAILLISMYGGAFSVSPAYLADTFGTKEVGNVYGKLLTAWSAAGLVGPTLLATLRRRSEVQALHKLALEVDAQEFHTAFGKSPAFVQELIDTNSLTISKLMTLAPPGTVDPTPFLYDSTMHTMAILLGVALVNNLAMRPVKRDLWVNQ